MGGDESHVARGASGFLAPVLEEPSITKGHQRGRVEAEAGGDGVDPFLRPLQFCEIADGGFVEDAMARSIGVFGTPLLIDKDRFVSELAEDDSKSVAVGNFGLGFYAAFVAGGRIVVGGHALVGEEPMVAVSSDSENRAAGAEAAVGRVVECIALEAAEGNDSEPEAPNALLKLRKVLDAKLDLGFDGAH